MKPLYSNAMRSLTLLLLACVSALSTLAQVENDDPDLPAFSRNVDKKDFLLRREAYLELLRTQLTNLPYNPRLKAIADKKQMETNQRDNVNNLLAGPNWVELGPKPIPNGQTTGSVAVSGRVTAIAIHPDNVNIVYVGTANGGIYRTVNGGNTWTAIFDAASSLAIGALALAPSDPTILYVGTGESNASADSYIGIGVYRINNAETAPVLTGPINPTITYTNSSGVGTFSTGAFTYRSISKIVVHPANPAIIFVSTATGVSGNPGAGASGTVPPLGLRGVYRSTNATGTAASVTFTKLAVTTGNSFDLPNTGNSSVVDIIIPPNAPDTLIAYVNGTVGDGGIYRSVNALAATPVFTKNYAIGTNSLRGELACAKIGGGQVIVYAATGESSTGVIRRSDDGGVTWNTSLTGAAGYCGGQCFYDIAIDVDPGNAAKVFIGGSSGSNTFAVSADSAKTSISATSTIHADVHVVKVSPSVPTTLYLGCDGGIWKSTDGGTTWISMNTAGFSATQFQSMALHPIDPKFTIGGTQDNGTNIYLPNGTFFRTDAGDGGYVLVDQNATDNTNVTMYHTYFNGTTQFGFARTTSISATGTASWSFLGCGGTPNGLVCPSTTMFYAPMALGPGNPNTLYIGSDRLYRSADKGTTMVTVSQAPIVSSVPISTIAISRQNDNVRLVGLKNGNVWATATGVNTLTNISPVGAPAVAATRVFVDPNNANIAYVTYAGYGVTAGQHIWKTTNLNLADVGGTTWSASGNGLPDVPVNCITADASNSNVLFCGTDIGVFVSTDAGGSWSSFSAGLPVVPVFDIAVHPVTKNLRIATHGRGFWESTDNALPVDLTSFTATPKPGGKVYLQWYTATETNNKGFDVERAVVNGTGVLAWKKIGFVNGSGTSTSAHRYYFDDEPIGGRKFIYRLKQFDFDNRSKFSEERQVQIGSFDFALFPVYPNPVSKTATIRYQVNEDVKVRLSLYQADGKMVKQLVNESKDAGIYQVEFDVTNLPAGNYYYKIEAGNLFDTKRMVIQKN
ncbi:MAG: T9SS type A sorting domain-containing protein [Chitinophagaceae bacterium]